MDGRRQITLERAGKRESTSRARVIAMARKAYFTRLALSSAQARRRKAARQK